MADRDRERDIVINWKTTTLNRVAGLLGCSAQVSENCSDGEYELTRPSTPWDADASSLCFLQYIPSDLNIFKAKPGLVIALPGTEQMLREAGFNAIFHDKPKFAFCKAVFNLMRKRNKAQIHPTAIISPTAKIGEGVAVGPYCVIQGDIVINDDVTLEDHVSVYNNVKIGYGTTVRAGCRIGYDPFSFGINQKGESFRFPAYGSVQIGSFVEIYHNVSVARGVTNATVIEDWVRIGNHAHIGNSVTIGSGTTVCAQTDISSEVHIGSRCWIAQSAAIRQKLNIGDDTVIGMGAVVVADIPANVTVTGVPARISSTKES